MFAIKQLTLVNKTVNISSMLSLILRQSPKELRSTFFLLQKRNYLLKIKTSEKSYRRKDNVADSFSIIYKAPMEYYMTACNYITAVTVMGFSAYGVFKFINRNEEVSSERVEVEFMRGNAAATEVDMTYFALASVVFVAAIRSIVYKYPLRIYRNQSYK